MRLLSTGKVGIGTTTPDEMLTVAGNIHSQTIIVSEDAGADFVFAPNYDLPSLDEVAVFIEKHRHLPEIPSAEEMINEGLDLGDFNIKLLQKIEELTLYMIAMKEENEALKDRLQSVEQQLDNSSNR